jgi:hypothetical protein
MNLDNETAENLTEALNNLSNSIDAFVSAYPEGIRLSELTHTKLDTLNNNLKNFNRENEYNKSFLPHLKHHLILCFHQYHIKKPTIYYFCQN